MIGGCDCGAKHHEASLLLAHPRSSSLLLTPPRSSRLCSFSDSGRVMYGAVATLLPAAGDLWLFIVCLMAF